ncbi:hypothetical protein J3R82DRAFT_8814, partial [Butyriboletus roseoflavus]
YEIVYDSADGSEITSIHYGRLECVLVCTLGDLEWIWKALRNSTILLALVTPAVTSGQDASSTNTSFSRFAASLITDVRNIKAAIGRVQT